MDDWSRYIEKCDELIFYLIAALMLFNHVMIVPVLYNQIALMALWTISGINVFLYLQIRKKRKIPPRKIAWMKYWHLYCTFFFLSAMILHEIIPETWLFYFPLEIVCLALFLALVVWTFLTGMRDR